MDGISTITVTCTAKHPEITEDSIPTMADIKRGGYSSCIICSKEYSMYALRNHVESKHYVKIGDPLEAWLRAAERWNKEQLKNSGHKPVSKGPEVSKVDIPASKAKDRGKSVEEKVSELAMDCEVISTQDSNSSQRKDIKKWQKQVIESLEKATSVRYHLSLIHI